MADRDDIIAEVLDDRVAEVRAERDRHKARADRLAVEVAELRRLLDLHDAVAAASPKPPRWLAPKKKSKGHVATPVLILSDLHLDEVVNPAEIQGLNAFNRDIAERRLRKAFDKTVELTRHYLAGVTYDGIVVCLGGDLLSGTLHDLAETNEDYLLSSALFWTEHISAGLEMLAGEFGNVYVPVVVGNHGRLTKKPRT
ncbi:MAG: hypothetical protein N2037_10200, partial [Acidimicrobiales bacterium]|nr:hypothetical protein [Acidimicrobiales bacterium]